MRMLTTVIAFLASAGAAFAWGPLTQPGETAEADLILDLRAPEAFAAGHLPGAVNTPYGLYRGPATNPGQLVDVATVEGLLEAAGARTGDDVLIVYQGENASDFGAAARVYWTLKSVGFDSLSILNGGQTAWVAAGLELSTQPQAPAATQLTLSWDDTWSIDRAGVEAVIDGESDAVLIDARPDAFFQAETRHPAAKEAGTLRGAISLVNFGWFGGEDSATIGAPEALVSRARALAEEAGDAPLVSFCNTGHWAATNWFALSEIAGVEEVRLYPESMVGWTLFGGRAVPGGA